MKTTQIKHEVDWSQLEGRFMVHWGSLPRFQLPLKFIGTVTGRFPTKPELQEIKHEDQP